MNPKTTTTHPDVVDARPAKSFFVDMLTRDIQLIDAVLDLLDNCVDGILRSANKRASDKPYKGFYAKITFSDSIFSIHDNCGGIPWALHDYAFKMGRPKDAKIQKGGVGAYGIGMKRAIFKIGKECLISTKNQGDSYEVKISSDWIIDEDNWYLPTQKTKPTIKEDGTTVCIKDIYPGISTLLGHDSNLFEDELYKAVSSHYALIIDRGFEVFLNGKKVEAKIPSLVFSDIKNKNSIKPFIYRAKTNGVEVYLAVGFTRPIPSQEELDKDQEGKLFSSKDAGWTVICNDRVVLYNDKSELTGWGEAGLPSYHTQFIAISGIVEFKSDDPRNLPTTTTKRGINANSTIYLQVKNKMREGMGLFINYTNKWKSINVKEGKENIKKGKLMPFEELKKEIGKEQFRTVIKGPGGKQFRPNLPLPPPEPTTKQRIAFVRETNEIKIIGKFLLDDADASASKVGESCFDRVLKEARK
ncbi:MAG TPA: ATP-binding protein [bacterium]|nr:ATP-binding protein [bacterium]